MAESRPTDEPKDLNELTVPEPEVYIDGLDAQRRAGEFFENVMEFIGNKERLFVEVRLYEFARPGDGKPTEDKVHALWVSNHVVATVYEIREALNYTQFLPAHYLTPDLLEELRSDPPF